MSSDVRRDARSSSGWGRLAMPVGTSTRIYALVAYIGIGAALAIMIVASLTRASWMGPPMAMPGSGPPLQALSWRIPLDNMAVALWLSAVVGGIGVRPGCSRCVAAHGRRWRSLSGRQHSPSRC